MVNSIAKFVTIQKNEVKQLRRDAIKLETVAKHLRQQAKDIADRIRSDARAEKARANFYSKPANIDKSITLTPDQPSDNIFRDGDTKTATITFQEK